jgi:hypothetical protein
MAATKLALTIPEDAVRLAKRRSAPAGRVPSAHSSALPWRRSCGVTSSSGSSTRWMWSTGDPARRHKHGHNASCHARPRCWSADRGRARPPAHAGPRARGAAHRRESSGSRSRRTPRRSSADRLDSAASISASGASRPALFGVRLIGSAPDCRSGVAVRRGRFVARRRARYTYVRT